jgi:hypothetical protein
MKPVSINVGYNTYRNTTCSTDKSIGRKTIGGYMPISEALKFPTDQNVRDYIGAVGTRDSIVNRAIYETLCYNPEKFPILNSGITFMACAEEHSALGKDDSGHGSMVLQNASLINGSQTQGVIGDFISEKILADRGKSNPSKAEIYTEKQKIIDGEYDWRAISELCLYGSDNVKHQIFVRYEGIITSDEDLIAETSISRNCQNEVEQLSIVVRLGELDELDKAMTARNPIWCITKRETDPVSRDGNDGMLDAEKLIQVVTVMTPAHLIRDKFNPVSAYNLKVKCLRRWENIWRVTNDKQHPYNNPVHQDHESARNNPMNQSYPDLYKLYVDIAPDVWELYTTWRNHPGWRRTRLGPANARHHDAWRSDYAPDGIVFPILYGFSSLIEKKAGKYKVNPYNRQLDDLIINQAKQLYQNMAASSPVDMGKNKDCYATLKIHFESLQQILAMRQ